MTPSTVTVSFRGPIGHVWATLRATTRAQTTASSAYLIDIVRAPVYPALLYVTYQVTYAASGRGSVGGTAVSGFLLVGMVGIITWSSTIWSSGYAIEHERAAGTIGALFLSPASRAAVVLGYGLASLLWLAPSFAVIALIAFVTGTHLHVVDPTALAAAFIALLVASLATGCAFAGLFILSRRANLLANFLQLPIYLLAGFVVPRARLPNPLHALSDIIPAGQAVDALRASSLSGATLHDILRPLSLALGTAAICALIGWISLRRVEHVAKWSGTLDLS